MRLLFFVISLYSAGALAQTCADIPGGIHYCIYDNAGSANPDVIYYFHGRFGQAERWGETDFYTEQVRKEWIATGKAFPRVISVSFGPVWLLAEKNSSHYSGLFEVMRDSVIPLLENALGAPKGQRIILGESMGGVNSLQMALKTNLFQKAAVLCAPVAAGVSPFSSPEEIDAWIRKSAAFAYYGEANRKTVDEAVGSMLYLAQQFWPKEEDWATGDILKLAAEMDKSASPMSFYVNAGFYDQYALYEGNIELVKVLLSKAGVKVEWHPEWGDHCKIDAVSLARFLVP